MESLISEGPVAWRVSWTYWLGYNSTSKKRKSNPEHKDFLTREGAEAYKQDLLKRYTSATACISPQFITAQAREKEYSQRQGNIAKSAGWPLQARKP